MPMDGVTLGFIARETEPLILGGRIDKITQPEKDTILILIRAGSENRRLLLCASPNNARCHLTTQNAANPLEPPMFCMLLRKQLTSGRVISLRQIGGDRVLHLTMDTVDEMGDHVTRTLILEVMGRNSNLILVGENGKIIDAVRHVSMDMSRVRQIQPGLTYAPPPSQDKLDPAQADEASILQRLQTMADTPLNKAIGGMLTGYSPQAARELCFRMTGAATATLTAEELPAVAEKLAGFLRRMPTMASPVVQTDASGDPIDVYPFPYLSCDTALQNPCDSLSGAMEKFFGVRDRKDRIDQKSASLVRLLKTHIERCEKKLALQNEELNNAARMDEYRICGELLNANLWQLHKGMEQAVVTNFYDENGAETVIVLDKQLTPAQNAQRYFKKYAKARSARETAAAQKEKTEAELNYLEGALLDMGKCVGESELAEIREELRRTGYVRAAVSRKQAKQLPPSKPYRYCSADGIDIEVGKNAMQNDRLTSGAKGEELWLHAKDMPGSHVIVHTEGTVPEQTLREALQLAAWYSKGQKGSNVPIDYTLRKYVKKPGGAAPGFVHYTNQHTAYMTVEESDIRKIKLVSE